MKTHFDFYSRGNQLIIDGTVFALALVSSYTIRFEGWPTGPALHQLLIWLPILVGARILVYVAFGTYRLVWRFVSLPDALAIAKSIAVITVGLLLLRFLVPEKGTFAEWAKLPASVIALEGLLSLTGSLGTRALRRVLYSHQKRVAATTGAPPKQVFLYGAGRAGILLRRELENNHALDVIGFVDDDTRKIGSMICSTPVLGGGEALAQLVRKYEIDEVIISMATASRQTLARIVAKCRAADVPAKIIPSVQEILAGQVRITQLRETRAEELLGRESVEVPGFGQVAAPVYRGKRVLVTGAGGSIGSELVRQLTRLDLSRIAVLDKDENSIYELEQELLLRKPPAVVDPQIADVRDVNRLRALFSEFRPQVVFHAAAHKHVPLMEKHPCEAILNNVRGTKNVLDVAGEFRVERFVFISSDKAVNPFNVMGATKRIGEMLVQASVNGHGVRSACVRFGNVLGSRGSVIPLFQKQIAEGGPLTVTHPDVVRYFMTVQEAVQLILCAGTMARNGETFVLDMGNPRNILDLAREMIILSGLEPGRDIETVITGLRPGEKLYEELTGPTEKLLKTRFEKLSMIEPQQKDTIAFWSDLSQLLQSAEENDSDQIYEILSDMPLGFNAPIPKCRAAAASD